jgi:hypothetical protein
MSHLIKDWNGRAIRIRADRHVCLTDMANACGKTFSNWYRLAGTRSYLETLSTALQICGADLIEIVEGGNPQFQGTWGHPKVALRFAQWCSDEFAVQVDCWIDELLTTGSVTLTQPKRPKFYDRLQLFQERTGRIPAGYFCIFEEIVPLVSQLERHGYNLPDDAVIDGSIGSRFCTYLRNDCDIEPDDICPLYPHWFPGRPHPVKAKLYPLSLIRIFREWLEFQYYQKYMIPYFKGRKDAEAIQAVSKFLGLLPPQ